ncbi:SMP-30/gluconolactonase/LRE family protein [Poritiphilus flavus]|uniref:SMP-30/Gluconolactonase/LRE-like region domain-containing protein n=1 Tax=Poritiphilus flavus TaxID=2697053 RepID=A0A6L9EAF3_9FLAO|nr:SMP-30/gluconolactonase/LRE family protein [Poritiphilus flavus]NAS11528.1 hypothetical protein [Poritiphilus flavus]
MTRILILSLLTVIFADCKPGLPKQEYLLDELDLVPEGIAYDSRQNKLFLTSIAKSKIITVDIKTGLQEDFITTGQHGFMPGVGILIDEKREVVHALAGYFPLNDSMSSLYTLDLNTKKLLSKLHPLDSADHFLNDLVMDKKGNLYITDSKASAIYKMEVGADKLERIYGSQEIQYPNGIAISEDDSKLYIASFTKGVRILDLASRELVNEADANNWSQGIDGLEFYRGHLYAVQNGVRLHGDNFRKLILNETQDSITAVEQILSKDPRLDLPLTFCIVDDKALLIANSNLQYLDQSTLRITEPDSLKPTKLIALNLVD